MIKHIFSLLIVVVFLPNFSFAGFLGIDFKKKTFKSQGTEGGGGGAGICINKKCKTLAEAGLRIKGSNADSDSVTDPTNYWVPPLTVRNQLENIRKKIPNDGFKFIIKESLGHFKTFVIVEKVSDRKFKKIISDYKQALKDSNLEFDTSKLVIFAISENSSNIRLEDRKTYLLPDFFKLSDEQQALMLIHEARIRKLKELSHVLFMDGLTLDFLNNSKMSLVDYLSFVSQLNNTNSDEILSSANQYTATVTRLIIERLELEAGRPLKVSDFIDNLEDKTYSDYIYFRTYKLRDRGKWGLLEGNKNITPIFSNLFEHASVNFIDETGREYSYSQYYDRILGASPVCDEENKRAGKPFLKNKAIEITNDFAIEVNTSTNSLKRSTLKKFAFHANCAEVKGVYDGQNYYAGSIVILTYISLPYRDEKFFQKTSN